MAAIQDREFKLTMSSLPSPSNEQLQQLQLRQQKQKQIQQHQVERRHTSSTSLLSSPSSSSSSSSPTSSIPSSSLLSPLLSSSFLSRIRHLPIFEFYHYMFRVNPSLFFSTLFVNYLFPFILELMPWYASRRKLSKILRESRNAIQHRLIANHPFDMNSLFYFSFMSIVYAALQTLEQVLRTRVQLANRLVVKRLIMERILYSELGSLQSKYMEIFGEEVRTEQLELHVFSDISETLQLFNSTIPAILRGMYTFVLSAYELWTQRDRIDLLAIIRPTVVGIGSEMVNLLREKYVLDVQTINLQRNQAAMSRVVTNIVDGLSEIQVNNMQSYQLNRLDDVIDEEIGQKQGPVTFVNNVYRVVSNRNVIDFVSEVYIVKLVMERRGIDHETYRQIQNDIDSSTRLFARIWSLMRDGYRVLDTQSRVIALLNLPSFIQERKQQLAHQLISPLNSPTFQFENLIVYKCRFRYKENLPYALDIKEKDNETGRGGEWNGRRSETRKSVQWKDVVAQERTIESRLDEVKEEEVDNGREGKEEESKQMNGNHQAPSLTSSSPSSSSSSTSPSTAIGSSQSYASTSPLSSPSSKDASEPLSLQEIERQWQQKRQSIQQQQKQLRPSLISPSSSSSSSASTSPTSSDSGILRFDRGKSYAVVGQNRSGKSTLMQILCKLYSPPSSEDCDIRLNSLQYSSLPRTHLRSLISYIAQRPFIFPGTIEDNIRIGNITASNEEVEEAAEAAGLFMFDKPKLIVKGRSGREGGEASLVDRSRSNIQLKPWEESRLKSVVMKTGKWAWEWWKKIHRFDDQQFGEERDDNEDELEGEEVKEEWDAKDEVNIDELDQDFPSSHVLSLRRRRALQASIFSSTVSDILNKTDEQGSSSTPSKFSPLASESQPSTFSINTLGGASSGSSSPPSSAPSSFSPSSASSISSSSSSRPIHPTLLMETAERGSNLSGGFAQSVALARVFLRKQSQLIILDEAMGQMDGIKKREYIFPRLFAFVKKYQITLIIVSHDLPAVCMYVDKVFVMEKGECVEQGSHEELVAKKAQAYMRLIGAE